MGLLYFLKIWPCILVIITTTSKVYEVFHFHWKTKIFIHRYEERETNNAISAETSRI